MPKTWCLFDPGNSVTGWPAPLAHLQTRATGTKGQTPCSTTRFSNDTETVVVWYSLAISGDSTWLDEAVGDAAPSSSVNQRPPERLITVVASPDGVDGKCVSAVPTSTIRYRFSTSPSFRTSPARPAAGESISWAMKQSLMTPGAYELPVSRSDLSRQSIVFSQCSLLGRGSSGLSMHG